MQDNAQEVENAPRSAKLIIRAISITFLVIIMTINVGNHKGELDNRVKHLDDGIVTVLYPEHRKLPERKPVSEKKLENGK